MSDGCTSCGNKGGCDHRKAGMFAAIQAALGRRYPTRCFDDRVDGVTGDGGDGDVAPVVDVAAFATELAERLGTLALAPPPAPDEYCQHVWLLCLGRQPSLIEALHGGPRPAREDLLQGGVSELYLRVSISELAPLAAVQQVAVRGELAGDDLIVEIAPRTGVFDPVLLPRLRRAVAVIVAHGLESVDFGDISAPPEGYDPGEYAQRFGAQPALANYLFYPQPCSSITTTVVPFAADPDDVPGGARYVARATSAPMQTS